MSNLVRFYKDEQLRDEVVAFIKSTTEKMIVEEVKLDKDPRAYVKVYNVLDRVLSDLSRLK